MTRCYCWRNGGKKCRTCLSQERAAASTLTIEVGRVYEAVKPRPIHGSILSSGLMNDRVVVWMSSDRSQLQWDGPALAFGRKYPMMTVDEFKAWAGKDITDVVPDGEWRVAS